MRLRATTLVLAAVLVAAVLSICGDAAAQRRPRRPWGRAGRLPPGAPFARRAVPEIGLRGGYDFKTDAGSVGIDMKLPAGRRGFLALAPSWDLFFDNPGNDWQGNIDAELRAPRSGLYAGGGAAFIHHEFDPLVGRETKPGWNLFAGLEPPAALPIRPFVETRWTFRGEHYSAFRLVGGLRLQVGGRRMRP